MSERVAGVRIGSLCSSINLHSGEEFDGVIILCPKYFARKSEAILIRMYLCGEYAASEQIGDWKKCELLSEPIEIKNVRDCLPVW